MNDWTCFLQAAAGISLIADTLLWTGLHPVVGVCFSKEVYISFLVLQLVKVQPYITLSCSF